MITKEEEVNKNFSICPACKGEKYFLKQSHDCWGRRESHETTCHICGGDGFIISSVLKKQIEKVLGI